MHDNNDLFTNMTHIQNMVRDMTGNKYPFMDVAKLGDDEYALRFAVAGYKKENISVEQTGQFLTIEGSWEEDAVQYLVEGIAKRKFHRQIPLQEHIKVKQVHMEDGMLCIHLVKEVPEEKKPKTFEIK
tara:strand:- start:464 stop:847 length:384 start_codon:yes stop_codon:yes gene_type:complete